MMFADELDRLTDGDRVRVPCHRHAGAGEYDALGRLSARTLRRLRGGGYLTCGGLPVDVLASQAGLSCDEFLDRYVRLALLTIQETWTARHRRQYARRAHTATQQGHRSFWYYRKAMGW